MNKGRLVVVVYLNCGDAIFTKVYVGKNVKVTISRFRCVIHFVNLV